MPAIQFEEKTAELTVHPYRMDVALFVGLAPLRPLDRLPDSLVPWYRERGWLERLRGVSEGISLRDVPVAVDSWETFRRFFFWPEPGQIASSGAGVYPLGRAVKAFFAHGGIRAYVVSMADPVPAHASEADRIAALERLLYGTQGSFQGASTFDHVAALGFSFPALPLSAEEPGAHHGIRLGSALSDTALVAFPDVPYLVARPMDPVSLAMPQRADPEIFTECSAQDVPVPYRQTPTAFRPLCDEAGYTLWGRTIHCLLRWISENARDWQLIASLPPPHPSCGPTWWSDLCRRMFPCSPNQGGCASAFLHCAFPWLRDAENPNDLLAPEGPLMGLLAVNALRQGAFRSAAGSLATGVLGLDPSLSFMEREKTPKAAHAMNRRLCLFESTPAGIRLTSDRTASPDPAYGPGCISRLMGFVLKAARRLGEGLVLENSSPRSWRQVERGLSTLLEAVHAAGGLGGSDVREAFQVSCGDETMTAEDRDSGRLIARVVLQPAVPVEAIRVVLALEPGGTFEAIPYGGQA